MQDRRIDLCFKYSNTVEPHTRSRQSTGWHLVVEVVEHHTMWANLSDRSELKRDVLNFLLSRPALEKAKEALLALESVWTLATAKRERDEYSSEILRGYSAIRDFLKNARVSP